MDNISSSLYYLDPNPKNRGYEFFDNSVTLLRRDWIPIVNRTTATQLRLLLDSRQSVKNIQDSFDDKDFKKHVVVTPLGIMNSIVNSMVEEMRKAPPRAEVRAQDPSAMVEKKKDLDILRNRKILERDRTELQKRVFGEDSQYKLPYDKYKGNVKEFDEMGLDENDPDDINFFGTTFHRLDFELASQTLVNEVMRLCKFDQIHAAKYVRDSMAVNVNCGQTYVDRVTGEIKNEYIYPEDYYHIPSDTEDGHNDICKGFLKSSTIAEFLSRVGNNFDWTKDWQYLIWAINYCNNTKYTGFLRGGIYYDCMGNPDLMTRGGMDSSWQTNIMDWSSAYRYKVYMGYTEWLCPEVTQTYLKRKGGKENDKFPVDYTTELQVRPLKGRKKKDEDGTYYANEYEKESWYQWQLYGASYLATTMTSQYIFSYGKVYHTLLEGANDEYARYTCWSFRNQGKSVAEIAAPIVEAINFAWYRLLWILYKAKPEEEQFLINELLEVAKGIQQQFNQQGTNSTIQPLQSILDQVIQYQRQKNIRVRAYPRIDGREIGQLPPLTNEKRGIDPLSAFMQGFITFGQQLIYQQIGFNPMRVGSNPPSRESYKTEQSTLEASYSSTGYVGRMIQYVKTQMATTSMLLAQDVAKFKDSVAYRWICTLIGEEQMEGIAVLDKMAAHRLGIFVEDVSDAINVQDIKQAATIALQEKQINFEQWFIVTQTKNTIKAAQLLAYLQRKAEKRIRRQQIEDMKMQDQMAQNAHQRKMEELEFDRETKWGQADRDRDGFLGAAQINKEGKIDVQELKEANALPKEQAKTQGKIQEKTAEKNLEHQEPFTG